MRHFLIRSLDSIAPLSVTMNKSILTVKTFRKNGSTAGNLSICVFFWDRECKVVPQRRLAICCVLFFVPLQRAARQYKTTSTIRHIEHLNVVLSGLCRAAGRSAQPTRAPTEHIIRQHTHTFLFARIQFCSAAPPSTCTWRPLSGGRAMRDGHGPRVAAAFGPPPPGAPCTPIAHHQLQPSSCFS
jgi:hypothetical protein